MWNRPSRTACPKAIRARSESLRSSEESTGSLYSCLVLPHDLENATFAVNRLEDSFSASAALVDEENHDGAD